MNDIQRRFLQLVTGPALQSERSSAIPAAITIAQAVLESGWGQSQLFLQANNPFGIKATHLIADNRYKAYEAPTQEYTQDQWHTVQAAFQKFQNLGQAFERHAQLLLTQRYGIDDEVLAITPLRLRCTRIAILLQRNGYATDPVYASKLMEIIQENHLDEAQVLAGWASQHLPETTA